ncbi:MAG: decaprenyl-phosphate phosphoribosyltransferase [bacterium]
MRDYYHLFRAEQWVKNIFIFAGLIFSREFHQPEKIGITLLGFVIFSFLCSAGYIINDIIDRKEDRHISTKINRPIASGRIKVHNALILSVILIILTFLASFRININFFYVVFAYIGLSILYSLVIKYFAILDVLVIAIGYVLRSVAGAVIINVDISSWLILCTFLLALFIILSKRKAEIRMLGSDAIKHRRVLFHYSVDLLNQMIAIAISACVVTYCIYTLSPDTISKFHTRNMVFTVPFVIYGLFRYLYLTEKKSGTDMPNRVLIRDLPMMVNFILWGITCILILR